MSWACLLSAHGHGSVKPILQGPSGFIFIIFSIYPKLYAIHIHPVLNYSISKYSKLDVGIKSKYSSFTKVRLFNRLDRDWSSIT